MNKYNYLFLVSDKMAQYTLTELNEMKNVSVINKCFIPSIERMYLSTVVNNIFDLPFKFFFYKRVFDDITFLDDKPICIILTPPWFNMQLIKFLNKKFKNPRFVLKCGDTLKQSMKANKFLSIQTMKTLFDLVIVYNQNDADGDMFRFCPVGYSKIESSIVPKYPHTNVAFIGAAKDRIGEIHEAYRIFKDNGLICDFYVTGVSPEDRVENGIVYAEKPLDFLEYLGRECAADCLFEVLQHDSIGRTYRMMEAIIYGKKLITNCPEILEMDYYNESYIQFYDDVTRINPDFVKNNESPKYNYKGEFSPVNMLRFVSQVLNEKA